MRERGEVPGAAGDPQHHQACVDYGRRQHNDSGPRACAESHEHIDGAAVGGHTTEPQRERGSGGEVPAQADGGGPVRVATVGPKAKRGVVLEIGDSLGEDLAWGMPGALAGTGDTFVGAAQGDTGLAATWYFNWPSRLRELLVEYHPVVVVVFMGANDVQDFYYQGRYVAFGSKLWSRVYGPRAAELVGEATAAGAKVLWVGMPPMADQSLSSAMQTLNGIYRRAVSAPALVHRASYLSTWPVLSASGGGLLVSVPSAAWPGSEQVRAPDGIHITPAGAAVVARAVVAKLRRLGWL